MRLARAWAFPCGKMVNRSCSLLFCDAVCRRVGEVIVSERVVDAVKVLVKNGWTSARVLYLLITQDKLIIADLLTEASQPSSQGKAIALGGVIGQAILHARSAREDTDPKKHLRAVLDAYEGTRDQSILASLSWEQILEADPSIETLRDSRIIPFSSLSKLDIKRPGRITEGKMTVAWQVTRTSLSGREYTTSNTRELIVVADRWRARKLFPALIETMRCLFPNLTVS